MIDLIENGCMRYSNDCWDFYKPNYKMKNGEWLVASTVTNAIRFNSKIPYTYRKMLADIETVVINEAELDKSFLPMRQKQYFKKQGNYYDALISKVLVMKILALYKFGEKKIASIIRQSRRFDVHDYLQKYEYYTRCKQANTISKKVPKLDIKPYCGSIVTREDIMVERVNNLRKNATDAEKAMCKILSALNVEYIFQYACNIGYDIIMDFYIPSKRISIEIDGGYHNDVKQLMSDRQRDQYCAHHGILVLRYSNEFAQYPTQDAIQNMCNVLGCTMTDDAKEMCVTLEELDNMYKNKYTKEYFQNLIHAK